MSDQRRTVERDAEVARRLGGGEPQPPARRSVGTVLGGRCHDPFDGCLSRVRAPWRGFAEVRRREPPSDPSEARAQRHQPRDHQRVQAPPDAGDAPAEVQRGERDRDEDATARRRPSRRPGSACRRRRSGSRRARRRPRRPAASARTAATAPGAASITRGSPVNAAAARRCSASSTSAEQRSRTASDQPDHPPRGGAARPSPSPAPSIRPTSTWPAIAIASSTSARKMNSWKAIWWAPSDAAPMRAQHGAGDDERDAAAQPCGRRSAPPIRSERRSMPRRERRTAARRRRAAAARRTPRPSRAARSPCPAPSRPGPSRSRRRAAARARR